MKKNLLGVAALPLLALLATSCGNESVEQNADLGNVITFRAATGKQTISRASEVNLTTLQDKSLQVYSYKPAGGAPFATFNLTYSGGSWGYGTPVYHPISTDLYHYSVYPAGAATLVNASGVVTFNYTIGTTDTNQVDLMVASGTTTPTNALVTLVYRHILSQVNFAVKGKAGLTVGISNIQLTGLKNSGTFSYNSGWDATTLSGDATYDYNPNVPIPAFTDDDEIIPLSTVNNALMLMPQSLTSTTKLSFDWTLNLGGGLTDSGIVNIPLTDLSVDKWTMGKRYLYTMVFSPEYITFEVDEVDPWVNYDEDVDDTGIVDVDVPRPII